MSQTVDSNLAMDEEKAKATLPCIPFRGIPNFLDFCPLLNNRESFRYVIDKIVAEALPYNPTVVVGIEMKGVAFAPAVAYALCTRFVIIRKKGKLPRNVHSVSFEYVFGVDELELQTDALTPDDRVLLVDNFIVTGASMVAGIDLVKRCNAKLVALATVVFVRKFAKEFGHKYQFDNLPLIKALTFNSPEDP